MSTTIRVKYNTWDWLKRFYDEPYNFKSLDQVIKFLLRKEFLFELVVQKIPDLLKQINGIIKDEKIRILEIRVKDLKEGKVYGDKFLLKEIVADIKPCILDVDLTN